VEDEEKPLADNEEESNEGRADENELIQDDEEDKDIEEIIDELEL